MVAETFKVLVVDDSSFMRRYICDLLNDDPKIEVIDTAFNGVDALEKIKSLSPDVVTMDIEMPEMDGLTALKHIMAKKPTPVIMLSSATVAGAHSTIRALELGAVDFVTKPSGMISLDLEKIQNELLKKVKIAAEAKRRMVLAPVIPQCESLTEVKVSSSQQQLNTIVAIGTSTGGPTALLNILSRLPGHLPAAVIVVQHMPAGFTASLANRLNSLCAIGVKEAEQGEEVRPGIVYVAPGSQHLEIIETPKGLTVSLTENISGTRDCPSVDRMMGSIAKCNVDKFGLLLTGMGKDGAQGMKWIKETGGVTIAQNELTSMVYGMPRAAVEKGCVDYITPISEIAALLVKLIN